LKNLITLFSILLSSSIGFSQTIFQVEYSIGKSGDSDYQTITDEVEDLTAGVVNGPSIFNIEPGFYEEKITVPALTGTSEANTVTFTSATSDAKNATIFSDTITKVKLFEVSHLTI
jgi:pectin methylesterase-like acyl-CoA thioesterase